MVMGTGGGGAPASAGFSPRDTTLHTPASDPASLKIVDMRGYRRAAIFVSSTLDKALNIQLMGQADLVFLTPTEQVKRLNIYIGDPVRLEIGSTTEQIRGWEIQEQWLMPWMYLAYTATDTPTVGQVNAQIIRLDPEVK